MFNIKSTSSEHCLFCGKVIFQTYKFEKVCNENCLRGLNKSRKEVMENSFELLVKEILIKNKELRDRIEERNNIP